MHLILTSFSRFQGWLCGGRRLDTIQEGRGLASLPQYLSSLVCDCSRSWLVQRWHHGSPHVWHPATRLIVGPCQERGEFLWPRPLSESVELPT